MRTIWRHAPAACPCNIPFDVRPAGKGNFYNADLDPGACPIEQRADHKSFFTSLLRRAPCQRVKQDLRAEGRCAPPGEEKGGEGAGGAPPSGDQGGGGFRDVGTCPRCRRDVTHAHNLHVYIQSHTHTRAHIQSYVNTQSHTRIQTHRRIADKHTNLHIYMRTSKHAHARTHAHTCTHMHTWTSHRLVPICSESEPRRHRPRGASRDGPRSACACRPRRGIDAYRPGNSTELPAWNIDASSEHSDELILVVAMELYSNTMSTSANLSTLLHTYAVVYPSGG